VAPLFPLSAAAIAAASPAWDPVVRGTPIGFPRDHGAHPGHRIEWWYVTGWLDLPDAREAAFQVTFFRARTIHDAANPSRFAPTQLMMAHAAVLLPQHTRLVHAQRSARFAFDLAGADTADTRVWIGTGADRWLLERDAASDRYRTSVLAGGFGFELALAPDGPPVLQGDNGYSQKGPLPQQASHYYSRPQLSVTGSLRGGDGGVSPVTGRAWFDHEWMSEALDDTAAGWDWAGLNFEDGSALMAYRIRARDGPDLRRFGMFRDAAGRATTDLAPRFEPIRSWRSPRTGASYPVAMRLHVRDGRVLELVPLVDDQELDSSASTGIVYWEGAVSVIEGGKRVGRGHLELTGYAGAL
jgi:predicted secreted hydrolase